MQIVHYSSKTKGLFVLSFIFFCFSWVQSFISTLELGCRVRNLTFRAFTLDVLSFISSSTSPTASPSSSALSLHRWLVRRGWFLCHFRSCLFLFLFLFFFFSLKVGSREQPPESGPRWPLSLPRPPLPAGVDLRPWRPLARLWPFWAGAADVARRLRCRSQTMRINISTAIQ